jgi:hypothetical protein
MITRVTFIIAALLFWVSISSAQTGRNIDDHLLIRESRSFRGDYAKVTYEGSPYLNEVFQPGIVSTGELNFTSVPMRYNIFEDVLEYQVGDMLFLLEPDPKITRISLAGEVFVVGSGGKNQFYELEVEGNLSLLSRKVVNYRPKNDLTSVPAKYTKQSDIYFLRRANAPIEKVSNQKAFINFLPDKRVEVAEYAKAKNLSVKNIDDLVKLVNYYNSLFQLN